MRERRATQSSELAMPEVFQQMPYEQGEQLVLAGLSIPIGKAALLWDMDGVLLDTLSLDYEVVNRLLETRATDPPVISRAVVCANFPYDPPEFWRRILATINMSLPKHRFDSIVREYEEIRRSSTPQVHGGVTQILATAKQAELLIAVVSNNPEADISHMLSNAALLIYVDEVVGNDKPGLLKKPAPDPYLEAARRLCVEPSACVAIEDSLLGAEAGNRAGCFTVGVATGANSLAELSQSPFVSRCYPSLADSPILS
jgi:HAD superfamily hydrolase (TIGR01509 family)